LLDAKVKHEPTLVTADPLRRYDRVDFLCRAIDTARELGSDCVSLWSGIVRDGVGDKEAMGRLVDGLTRVLDHTAKQGMPLAFEPEPGMFIDTLDRYGNLVAELERAHVDVSLFQLTIDVGHLHCQGELPIAAKIRDWAGRLTNVHIEDMRRGVHEHLMFGDGEINFQPVIAALAEIGYAGLVGVELTRHSQIGPQAARQAYNFLQPLCEAASV
jgi:sugar phosphate isomerase/epimerase